MSRAGGPVQAAVAAVAFLLPLAAWPGLDQPFSAPKRALLALAVAALLPAALARRRSAGPPPRLQAVVFAWLASWAWSSVAAPDVSPEALVLGVAGPLWCLTVWFAEAPLATAAAHVAGAAVVAAVALGQAAGLDPFGWLGWTPVPAGSSARLRVYGTLGNPNFTGALLAMSAPLAALALERRRGWIAALVAAAVIAAALVATGSRAAALGLGAGAIVLALAAGDRRARLAGVAALLLAGAAIAASEARSIGESVRGRAYLWSVAWPHAWDRPARGHGPGSFELQYPGWERLARSSRRPGGEEDRFAGPQPHAHNDLLEALVERGLPGFVATVLVLGTPVLLRRRGAPRGRSGWGVTAGAAGAVAACATIACLDYPLERPAEAAALWMAVALGARAEDPNAKEDGPCSTEEGRACCTGPGS